MIFGRVYGATTGEIWEFDASGFTEVGPAVGPTPPDPETAWSFVYLESTATLHLVKLTGSDTDAEEFTWDGSAWSAVCTGTACPGPPDRALATPILLPGDRLFITGGEGTGSDCTGTLDDAYCRGSQLRGATDWIELSFADIDGDGRPSARRQAAYAYDAQLDRVLLFGGVIDWISGVHATDTLIWESGTGARPAQVFTVDLDATGVAPEAIVSLQPRWRAWGSGVEDDGAGGWLPIDGSRLTAWVGDGWQELADNDEGLPHAAFLEPVVNDLALIGQLCDPSSGEVVLAVEPKGVNGRIGLDDLATVTTDYVELRVRYACDATAGCPAP